MEDHIIVIPNGRTTHTYMGYVLKRATKDTSGVVTFVWDGSDYLKEYS